MDFYHFATVRRLQLLFGSAPSHTTHVLTLLDSDVCFVSTSCVPEFECGVHVRVCQCSSVGSAGACVCSGLIKLLLPAERPCYRLLFGGSNLKVTRQSVSCPSSLRRPQPKLTPRLLSFKSDLFTAASLGARARSASILMVKSREENRPVTGEQYHIVWRQEKRGIVATSFSLRWARRGEQRCCPRGTAMKRTLNG